MDSRGSPATALSAGVLFWLPSIFGSDRPAPGDALLPTARLRRVRLVASRTLVGWSVGVVDPGPSVGVEAFGWSEPDPSAVVRGFPFAVVDVAVVVPAEQATVGLVGRSSFTPGDQVMHLTPFPPSRISIDGLQPLLIIGMRPGFRTRTTKQLLIFR